MIKAVMIKQPSASYERMEVEMVVLTSSDSNVFF